MRFQMLYPEKRVIEGKHLLGWAQDVCADEERPEPANVDEAIAILSDRGLVTIGNYGRPLTA